MAALDTLRATRAEWLTPERYRVLRATVWVLYDLVADQTIALTLWRVRVRVAVRRLEPLIVLLVGARHAADGLAVRFLPLPPSDAP